MTSSHRTGGMLALMTDAFGGYGGIAQYNRDFLAAVAGIEAPGPVTVLTRTSGDDPATPPPRINQLAPIFNKFAYGLRGTALALRQQPRVIFNGHFYHGPLSMRLARLTGARLVSQLHGTEIWKTGPRACIAAIEASDLVLTVSRDTRARTLAKARIEPHKIVVINNTVGSAFTPGDRTAARRRFGLGAQVTILTVARLDARNGYKGHDRIIRLMPDLVLRGMDAVYLVAGEGPDRPRLECLARGLGVATRVRFLGKIPIAALPDLYRAADLFALPSTGEGFGISFVEAMACGTPAIGLAVGGAPDALADGALGACVSPDAFAGVLLDLLTKGPTPPADLAERTRAKFGFALFADQVRSQLARVW